MSKNPIIFHIPHSSCHIPQDLRHEFCLSDNELNTEILLMTDHYTDIIFSNAASENDEIIKFPVSRLVVDPERFVNDIDEPMSKVGMGAVYVKRHNGNILRRANSNREILLERFYYPHHKKFEEVVSNHLNMYGKAIILDCHSFPSNALEYELNKHGRRPDICIGTDNYHTPNWIREATLVEFRKLGFSVEFDTPFSGTFVPSKYYSLNSSVISIMIELRRDLYMNEASGDPNDDFNMITNSISVAINGISNSVK